MPYDISSTSAATWDNPSTELPQFCHLFIAELTSGPEDRWSFSFATTAFGSSGSQVVVVVVVTEFLLTDCHCMSTHTFASFCINSHQALSV